MYLLLIEVIRPLSQGDPFHNNESDRTTWHTAVDERESLCVSSIDYSFSRYTILKWYVMFDCPRVGAKGGVWWRCKGWWKANGRLEQRSFAVVRRRERRIFLLLRWSFRRKAGLGWGLLIVAVAIVCWKICFTSRRIRWLSKCSGGMFHVKIQQHQVVLSLYFGEDIGNEQLLRVNPSLFRLWFVSSLPAEEWR